MMLVVMKLARVLFLFAALLPAGAQQPRMRVAIAGLAHGHVDGFFGLLKKHPEIELVGVSESDDALRAKVAARYRLPETELFRDAGTMLDRVKPDAVAAFSDTYDHLAIVQACAAHKTPVMMEKPMAVSVAQARAIDAAVRNSGIPLIVNYETTWYASHRAIWRMIKEQGAAGEIRKMVAMDGHSGPKEIGVGPEFLAWLSDPLKNGAGALFDFGCYGANLMTWLMDGARPVAVTAVTQHYKPQIYPNVDDEANVLAEYPRAVGIIQGSWNWPYSRKDLEVYGEHGYAIATGGDSLRAKAGKSAETTAAPEPMPADDKDSVGYLYSVVKGGRKVEGLSSLANNVVVVEILDAARESAKTGRKVSLR
jgi:predicted dehydrogenase